MEDKLDFFLEKGSFEIGSIRANFEGGISLFARALTQDDVTNALTGFISIANLIYSTREGEEKDLLRARLAVLAGMTNENAEKTFIHHERGRFLAANLRQRTDTFVVAEPSFVDTSAEDWPVSFRMPRCRAARQMVIDVQKEKGCLPIGIDSVDLPMSLRYWSIDFDSHQVLASLGLYPERNPCVLARHSCYLDNLWRFPKHESFEVKRSKNEGLCAIDDADWSKDECELCELLLLVRHETNLQTIVRVPISISESSFGTEMWPELIVELLVTLKTFCHQDGAVPFYVTLADSKQNFCRALLAEAMVFINCSGTPVTFGFLCSTSGKVKCDRSVAENWQIIPLIEKAISGEGTVFQMLQQLNVTSFTGACKLLSSIAVAHEVFGSRKLISVWGG